MEIPEGQAKLWIQCELLNASMVVLTDCQVLGTLHENINPSKKIKQKQKIKSSPTIVVHAFYTVSSGGKRMPPSRMRMLHKGNPPSFLSDPEILEKKLCYLVTQESPVYKSCQQLV